MLVPQSQNLQAIIYDPSGPTLKVLNQLLLPLLHTYEDVVTVQDGWDQIREMKVRGAPAIAIVAALTLAMVLKQRQREGAFNSPQDALSFVKETLQYLITSRPTAVNLFNMADCLNKTAVEAANTATTANAIVDSVVKEAEAMLAEDVAINRAIGKFGRDAILANVSEGQRVKILTHCNTGALATAGYGTALGIIRCLHENNNLDLAYCTETRPYNQGARLTAYELVYEKIPAKLITDSMVAFLLKKEAITAVVVGADRVVANGDTANKVGTYQMAIACAYHNVPFFVAAPTTSIDLSLSSGEDIHIEERPTAEMTHVLGNRVAAPGISVWNPSFDVAPAKLITGIITEKGVVYKVAGAEEFNLREFLSSGSSV